MKFLSFISLFLLVSILAGCSLPLDSFTPFSREMRPSVTTEPLLTEQDAKLIALDHAKAKEADTKGLRLSFEYDEGVPEYDISFLFGKYAYEYEIHGVSGRIISYEREELPN